MEITLDEALTIQIALSLAKERCEQELEVMPNDEEFADLLERFTTTKERIGSGIGEALKEGE